MCIQNEVIWMWNDISVVIVTIIIMLHFFFFKLVFNTYLYNEIPKTKSCIIYKL